MPVFEYQAKKGPEKIVSGNVEAESESQAVQLLSQRGIVPISISQKKMRGQRSLRFGSISHRDIYVFTYQLVELLAAGLVLNAALDTLSKQTTKSAFGAIITDLKQRVSEGMSFSQALSLYPQIFDSFYVHMVRAGEASGNIEHVLSQLAVVYEKEDELRSRISQALAYPTLIALSGIVTVIAILTFVIPKLESMYADMGRALPFITMSVISISRFFEHAWWAVLLVIIAGIALIRSYARTSEGRGKLFDGVIKQLPIWGSLVMKEEIARFSRSLALQLTSGVSVIEALQTVSDIMRSPSLRNHIVEVKNHVTSGARLHEALQRTKVFPLFLINIVATGESSGTLDSSLLRVAGAYEKDMERTLKLVTTLLEPVMVLIIGVVVGVIVISMLLPIFTINVFVS